MIPAKAFTSWNQSVKIILVAIDGMASNTKFKSFSRFQVKKFQFFKESQELKDKFLNLRNSRFSSRCTNREQHVEKKKDIIYDVQ